MKPILALPEGWDIVRFAQAISLQLSKDFLIDPEQFARNTQEIVSVDEMLPHFSAWIENELIHNPDRLHASFYRLDLGENLVYEALSIDEIKKSSAFLASKSIERAAQKVLSRITNDINK